MTYPPIIRISGELKDFTDEALFRLHDRSSSLTKADAKRVAVEMAIRERAEKARKLVVFSDRESEAK